MIYHRRKGWELKEHAATSEAVFMNRRAFLVQAGLAASATLLGAPQMAQAEDIGNDIGNDIAAALYPAKRNEEYKVERSLTPEKISSVYNNFYEFGSHKRIYKAAQALSLSPWTIRIEGEVENPLTIGVEDLIKKLGIEERLYRHRCVEAWAMTVPWSGFALSKLLALVSPTSKANYVEFVTFLDKKIAFGQKQVWYPWPYSEAITLAEAKNDLAFMVSGVYGHPLQKQFGAPLRLALPWKYGFKSIKSIVRVRLTQKRPQSFWEKINPNEYGFWANVNPNKPHLRWSQSSEELLGEGRRVPTRLFNGYSAFVAQLYSGLSQEPLWH